MTITANAAAHIAAYGQHFSEHDGLHLRYVLHGRVPYDDITGLDSAYAGLALNTMARQAFETWFLPLMSLKERNGVQAGQLAGLLRYFHRARLAMSTPPDPDVVQVLRRQIRDGDPSWVTRKTPMAAAMSLDCEVIRAAW